jgi:hypothetical protein
VLVSRQLSANRFSVIWVKDDFAFLRRIAFPCDQICKVRSLVNACDMFDDNMKLGRRLGFVLSDPPADR